MGAGGQRLRAPRAHAHNWRGRQRRAARGAGQTSSQARIGSPPRRHPDTFLFGRLGSEGSCRRPFLATQPEHGAQQRVRYLGTGPACGLWGHSSALLSSGEGLDALVQTCLGQGSGHKAAKVTKVHENSLSLFFLLGPGRKAAGTSPTGTLGHLNRHLIPPSCHPEPSRRMGALGFFHRGCREVGSSPQLEHLKLSRDKLL